VIDRVLPLLVVSLTFAGFATVAARADEPARPAGGALNFQVQDIDGKPVDLAKTFQGKVLLVVNTASQCGYTPQYKGLEAIYSKYKARGFEVLAFPANEFGAQEPGSNSEIKAFCTSTYNVTFPIYSKIVVKGPGIHPLYQYLTDARTDPKFAGDISWNFNKFLIDRHGRVIARFDSGDAPESAKVTRAIEAALAESK
jgi:glutathione peroxidase